MTNQNVILAGDLQVSLDAAIALMQQDSTPAYQIDHFVKHFHLLASGFDSYVREADILPLQNPTVLESIHQANDTVTNSNFKIASLKLNGGLGTTMGLNGPKSLLPVKDGATFLSIVNQQYQNGHQGDRLLLMNSFNTHAATVAALQKLAFEDVHCFEQGRIPRLKADGFSPLHPEEWGSAAWCPPGHGQVLDIIRQDLAKDLLDQGIRYIFISNIDNLGAVVDRTIPEYMAAHNITWLTEVCQRIPLDIKGGHVAIKRSTGKLLVRDSNMTADQDVDAYSDIARHAFFSTNNIWLDLAAPEIGAHDTQLDLPLIVNRKHISQDQLQASVIQLETGIGTGISCFKNAQTLLVPRSRFIPVKDIAQWLVLRSDWFKLESDGLLTESDYTRRPVVKADSVSRGTAQETLDYFLNHPNFEHHLGRNILQ